MIVDEARPEPGFHILAPFRAIARLAAILALSLGCRLAMLCVLPVAIVSRSTCRRARKRIARGWIRGMMSSIGTRLVVHGTLPRPPFFIVLNHMSWIDLFAVASLLDATLVAEDPVSRAPIVGRIVRALNPIFVRRVKEDTQRVNDLMVETIESGGSIILAPETPITTIPPGSGVRMFRAGLFQSAVRTDKPVHYLNLTYETPKGYPPPTKSLLYGPNPYYLTPDGEFPESELEMWGPPRSFLWHALGLLALPWHRIVITFGAEPMADTDRIDLANRLHDAIEKAFVPVD